MNNVLKICDLKKDRFKNTGEDKFTHLYIYVSSHVGFFLCASPGLTLLLGLLMIDILISSMSILYNHF